MLKDNIPADIRADIEQSAKRAAQKLCGFGTCIFKAYHCGHEKSGFGMNPPLLGEFSECPMAKYHVEDRGHLPWFDRDLCDTSLDEREIACLCACCEHAEAQLIEEDGETYLDLTRKEIRKCMDCPVKAELDGIQEARAESFCN